MVSKLYFWGGKLKYRRFFYKNLVRQFKKEGLLSFLRLTLVAICAFSFAEAHSGDRRFSLVIKEGFGSIKIGDVNSTRSSTSSSFDVIREEYPGNLVGEYLPLPNNFRDWEGELRWRAWRGLSVGLSVSGPMHFSQTDPLTYSFDTGDGKYVENFL